MKFSSNDILKMDNRFRVNFINSLSGFKSANLIGTVDSDGQQNLAIISSVFHLGADPALMGFINRPDSVERHTLENIREVKQFTINSVNESIYQQAHQTSARYKKEQSEFEFTNLTPINSENMKAPYVEQSHLRIGLELVEQTKLLVNNTSLVIGKVTEVFVPEEVIARDGYIDIEKLQTVCVSGLDNYHNSKRLSRMAYAKV